MDFISSIFNFIGSPNGFLDMIGMQNIFFVLLAFIIIGVIQEVIERIINKFKK